MRTGNPNAGCTVPDFIELIGMDKFRDAKRAPSSFSKKHLVLDRLVVESRELNRVEDPEKKMPQTITITRRQFDSTSNLPRRRFDQYYDLDLLL